MRSDVVKKGSTRTAHRTLFHAMGYSDEDLQKPLIGVVNAFNEIIPGHMHLREIAEAVKLGIAAAGGTPIEFPAIGICDGIAMGHDGMKYPLASRELICDSIEAVANGHAFDGLVMIPNCDKIVPGMLMAAGRINIPTVVVSGGPMLAGRHKGRDISVSTMFEAAGKVESGPDDAGRNAPDGTRSLPGLRLLRRHLHGQHDELYDRSPGHGPSWQRHHSGGLFRSPPNAGEKSRRRRHGAGEEKYLPAGHHDDGIL